MFCISGLKRGNHREDKFLRATNYKHYGSENKTDAKVSKNSAPKSKKRFRALSFIFSISLAAALIVPTTTLAPDVNAFEDSKAASYSIGDIDEFAAAIAENCIIETTVPLTQEITTVAPTTKKIIKETKPAEEITEAQTEVAAEVKEAPQPETNVNCEPEEKETVANTEASSESKTETTVPETSGNYLIGISNPDYRYSPSKVTLSSYDRAKLERLVMGEAGSMGYNGCALVAQCIRDAMNRSNTASIDKIISDYKYYAPTNKEPNKNVKDAVSYIFDQNGSAVQHRILCFYTGTSNWHETQNFIVGCGNVRFFDLKY